MLPENEQKGLEIALRSHPAISASTNDIYSANAQYKSSKSVYYPQVSFEVDANYNNNIDGTEGENNDLTAMLRFKYNLFSGGKDAAYTKESAYKINEAKALNMNAHREVQEGFILSWNAFELLNEQKKYIQIHVEAAKDTQADYKEQFKVGQRTLLDLLDTENELYQARRDFLEAEFSEITAQYRILHSMGLLLNSLRVTRPESWKGEERFDGGVYHEND
jgi:adhesin transport system outer membrane protein